MTEGESQRPGSAIPWSELEPLMPSSDEIATRFPDLVASLTDALLFVALQIDPDSSNLDKDAAGSEGHREEFRLGMLWIIRLGLGLRPARAGEAPFSSALGLMLTRSAQAPSEALPPSADYAREAAKGVLFVHFTLDSDPRTPLLVFSLRDASGFPVRPLYLSVSKANGEIVAKRHRIDDTFAHVRGMIPGPYRFAVGNQDGSLEVEMELDFSPVEPRT